MGGIPFTTLDDAREGCGRPSRKVAGGRAAPARAADRLFTLALLNSRLAQVFLALTLGYADQNPGSPSAHFYVGDVQKQPFPAEFPESVTVLGSTMIGLRRCADVTEETTHSFVTPFLLGYRGATLEQRHAEGVCASEDRDVAAMEAQARIDLIAAGLYALTPDDRRVLDEEVEANPATFPASVPPDWSDERFAAAHLSKEAVAAPGPAATASATALRRAWLGGKRQKHRDIADLALLFGVHPSVIVDARRRLGLMRPEDLARAAHGLISYCVGCAFGRWDILVGQRAGETACQRGRTVASRSPGEAGEEAPDPAQGARGNSCALGDPFAPLPRCSPGMLQDADGLPLSPAELPADYPLRPPLDGILVDDPSEEADITRVVRRALEALFGAATPAIAEELRTALGADLRTYLRQSFFDAHLKAYSGSQRQAPLYWQVSSASRGYGLWLYYPLLQRDTLATALGKFVDPKLTGETEVLARLRREAAEPGASRALKKQAVEQEALVADVAAFRDVLRAAATTFEVDFSDGAVLNAAALAGLMRWKKAAEAAAALRKGEPAWSAAARRAKARAVR